MTATVTVLRLDSPSATSPGVVGGKAANLARLVSAGFSVPETRVVSVSAYHEHVATLSSEARLALDAVGRYEKGGSDVHSRVIKEMCRVIANGILRQPLRRGLLADLRRLLPRFARGTVAVRSSATLEDLKHVSFAGQYESFLDVEVSDEAIGDRIRSCWASLWSWRAVEYRTAQRTSGLHPGMAVIIQEMVDAKFAGVIFTRNPRLDDGTLLISYVPGLGDALVSGTKQATTVMFDRASGSRRPHEEHSADPNSAALGDDTLATLATLGMSVEQRLENVPQDIEWVVDHSDQVHLLQTRAITVRPPAPLAFVSEPETENWDRKILGEWLNEPLTPLFRSLLIEPLVARTEALFRRELGSKLRPPATKFIHGYLYVRMNVDLLGSLRAPLYMPRFLGRMDHQWEVARDRLIAFRTQHKVEYFTGSEEAELRELDTLAEATHEYGAWVLTSAVAALLSESLFARVARLFGYSELQYVRFLVGSHTASAAMDQALWRAAEQVREHDSLTRVANEGDSDVFFELLKMPEHAGVAKCLDEFLANFGHQSLDIDLVHPTFIESPGFLLALLRMYLGEARPDPTVLRKRLARDAAQACAEAERSLPRWSPKLRLFRRTLSLARRYAAIRDDRPFYLQYLWPQMRSIVDGLAGRFVDRGWLESHRSIYFLTAEELRCSVESGQRCFATTVPATRENGWLLQRQATPPDHVNFGGASRLLARLWKKGPSKAGRELTGHAGAPGRASGVARIVDSRRASEPSFGPNDILVTRFTTPAWTPFFAQVAAVVTEIGSPLSHAAIVAREFGIPCVIGVHDATSILRDGEPITVDGNRGTVSINQGAD